MIFILAKVREKKLKQLDHLFGTKFDLFEQIKKYVLSINMANDKVL